jgi:hypothetical protein
MNLEHDGRMSDTITVEHNGQVILAEVIARLEYDDTSPDIIYALTDDSGNIIDHSFAKELCVVYRTTEL